MKNSATYRFIASVLSISILIGVSVPAGLHAMSEDVCDEIQEMHHPMQPTSEHVEDCPMESNSPVQQEATKSHHQAHDLGFACACSIEEAPVKTEAQAKLKVKGPTLAVVQILAEIHLDESETNTLQIPVSDTYSPPPIYLANESFLN
ncbi:hypothetical protein [Gracilimonas sp.]|uniref:hypothetical protein n=1 Tax=Gracilimonas sp. TaxID=1974203 RepID=UPI00287160C4|nr:hypothetical protein [Gracilimonas sp.]